MALLPAQSSRKRKLFAASRPNYADYSGPSDGDYVRYVENLMTWAEQEQERQRLKAVGTPNAQAAAAQESAWGRGSANSSVPPVAVPPMAAAPGSVDSAVDRFKRKAQRQAAQLQRQAAAASSSSPAPAASQAPRSAQAKVTTQFSGLLFIGVLIAVGIFATGWLPAVIIGWVVLNVFRTVRAASRKAKS